MVVYVGRGSEDSLGIGTARRRIYVADNMQKASIECKVSVIDT
jgi:hypothetical protein